MLDIENSVLKSDVIKSFDCIIQSFTIGSDNYLYYTSREFPIQNFHRRTADIL